MYTFTLQNTYCLIWNVSEIAFLRVYTWRVMGSHNSTPRLGSVEGILDTYLLENLVKISKANKTTSVSFEICEWMDVMGNLLF